MSDILRASSGQQNEAGSAAGPSSYPTGGFSLATNLGRVDEATVQVDNVNLVATVSQVTGNTNLQVAVTDATTGSETTAGDDLSGDTFTYDAYRL